MNYTTKPITTNAQLWYKLVSLSNIEGELYKLYRGKWPQLCPERSGPQLWCCHRVPVQGRKLSIYSYTSAFQQFQDLCWNQERFFRKIYKPSVSWHSKPTAAITLSVNYNSWRNNCELRVLPYRCTRVQKLIRSSSFAGSSRQTTFWSWRGQPFPPRACTLSSSTCTFPGATEASLNFIPMPG